MPPSLPSLLDLLVLWATEKGWRVHSERGVTFSQFKIDGLMYAEVWDTYIRFWVYALNPAQDVTLWAADPEFFAKLEVLIETRRGKPREHYVSI